MAVSHHVDATEPVLRKSSCSLVLSPSSLAPVFWFFESPFYCIFWTDPKLPGSSNPPASAFPVPGATDTTTTLALFFSLRKWSLEFGHAKASSQDHKLVVGTHAFNPSTQEAEKKPGRSLSLSPAWPTE